MTAGTGHTHYAQHAAGYAYSRRPDPRIEAQLREALGDAARVVNVGAGAGSYEPHDRTVVAVEPSEAMTAQRISPASVVRAVAESLPFRDATFDAALAILTLHHWTDWERGIEEMRRVAGRVVLVDIDMDTQADFWLFEYFPRILEGDRVRFVGIEALRTALGPGAEVEPLLVPHDCMDGFLGGYWRTPEVYLRDEVRAAMSGFAVLTGPEAEVGLARLRADIDSGAWAVRNEGLLTLDTLDLGYRIATAETRL